MPPASSRVPFTVDDLYLQREVTSVHAQPGHPDALCCVRSVDRGNDTYTTWLWRQPLGGATGRALTEPGHTDTSARWSPQGDRIAFISNRTGDASQLHMMSADGGGLRALGEFTGGATDLRWLPDGRQLLVTAAVPVDPDLRGARSASLPAPRSPGAPEVAWRLPYKSDGVGYLLQREIALFLVDAETGAARRLTDGPFDVLAMDVSADGRRVAFTRTREGRFAHCTDLWVMDLDGTPARRLTRSHATVMQPAWSPDGRRIAFVGAALEGDAEPRLWVVDAAGGHVAAIAEDRLDVADGATLHWDADGGSLCFPRAWRGRHHLVSVDVDTAEIQVLAGGDRQIGAFTCTDAHLVYTVNHPGLPHELWVADARGRGERQVSAFNPWWHERLPVHVEARQFQVPDGRGGLETIEGWLLQGEPTGVPKPLLNDIHGGPASYALLDFDTNVFWQVLCTQGWAVLALNAVGSASHGREFCQRLAGHWGEMDLPQHLAALDALQREGVCGEALAVSGKSYGGYLSSWAVGHTDRFKAAVVMAPVGNIETHYGTSDGGYYADPLYVGTAPRFDRSVARELSPLRYIERSRTPTLFLQGKDDERCPKCQSEELFVSMARAGDTPAELVLYPGEGHGFLGSGAPTCRADAARRIIDWLVRHTLGAQDGGQ